MSQHVNEPAAQRVPQQRCPEAAVPAQAKARMQASPWQKVFGALALATVAAGCGGGGDDPPAAAAVAPQTCGSANGTAIGGLDLSGIAIFTGLSRTAGASGAMTFDPGEVTYFNPALPATALSGSLRVSLWASNSSYSGGTLTGQLVARSALVFAGGSNQLGNLQRSDIPTATLSATSPSRGSYCMVVTLEEFDRTRCSSADGYCIVDWAQFATSNEFQ